MTAPAFPAPQRATGLDHMVSLATAWVAERLEAATAARPRASLVVSGGRTPEPLHAALSAQPLAWERVAVTLADERWVPPGHPDSNEAMVRRTLLQGPAAAATLTGLYDADHAAPEPALEAVHARLSALPRPWDVVLLGMGADGHTASLFPDGDRLDDALSGRSGLLCEAMHAPSVPQPRITLTLPALLDATAIALLVTGEQKLRVLEDALMPGPVEALPIRAVLHRARNPVAIFWAP